MGNDSVPGDHGEDRSYLLRGRKNRRGQPTETDLEHHPAEHEDDYQLESDPDCKRFIGIESGSNLGAHEFAEPGKAEVINSYVYRMGMTQGDFSYATAVGLGVSIISVILLVTANKVTSKLNDNQSVL